MSQASGRIHVWSQPACQACFCLHLDDRHCPHGVVPSALFLDIRVPYSLSAIISTLPGAVLVGAPLASFLHLYLATSIFDALPKPSRRRCVCYWAAQLFVDGLLATSIAVASKQPKALCKALWPPKTCAEARFTDKLVAFVSPNLYVIFLITCITMLAMLASTGTHLCKFEPRHIAKDLDQEASP